MQFFPMFLRMAGRDVVIAGGGEQAAQKARLILKTEARLTLLAPTLDDELAAMVASGRARHVSGRIAPDAFAGTALVFVATGCPAADACLHALAKAAGATVNVVDRPELCDATTPSLVDRDPVVVAIGTEGTAPVLGRRIKTQIEQMLDPRLGTFATLAGRIRNGVADRVPRERRRAFWEWAFAGPAWHAHRRGAEREAARVLKRAMEAGGPGGTSGLISLVGAGPGARDLLTMRAVARLQEADVVFYDRLIDPDVLELARRDAQRVYVGKAVGASAWSQERIDRLVVAHARRGLRVVRLKSGDPSIFGRAGDELRAARSAGIAVEIVPGVTAASAAAASTGQPLTERGITDRVILTTGTCQPGDADPDWGEMAQPGATLVLYMAVGKLRELRDSLLSAGHPPETLVDIVEDASGRAERHLATSLAHVVETVERERVHSPAVVTLRIPKRRVAPPELEIAATTAAPRPLREPAAAPRG